MRSIRSLVAGSLALAFLITSANLSSVLSQSASAPAAVLDGFTPAGSTEERRWEDEFRAVPAPASAREHLSRLTAEPHVAGTKEDYATAVYVRDQMKGFGLQAELKEYQVLLPYPRNPTIVELIAPRRERLTVKEAINSTMVGFLG